MSTEVHVPETLPPNLAEKEAFLEEHGFGREARGLFYMGVLMYYIGEAQRVQGHETKPILDKISYGGMNKRDIEEFYLDILAKLRQYVNVLNQKNKVYITLPTLELYRKMVDQYMGNFHMHELTNEKRNVFYIMSGYSSCVMPLRKSSGAADKEEETDVEE